MKGRTVITIIPKRLRKYSGKAVKLLKRKD